MQAPPPLPEVTPAPPAEPPAMVITPPPPDVGQLLLSGAMIVQTATPGPGDPGFARCRQDVYVHALPHKVASVTKRLEDLYE